MWQITLKASLRHAAIGVPRVKKLGIKELADGQLRAGQVPGEVRAGLAAWGLWVDLLTRAPNLELSAGVTRVKAE